MDPQYSFHKWIEYTIHFYACSQHLLYATITQKDNNEIKTIQERDCMNLCDKYENDPDKYKYIIIIYKTSGY